MGYPHKIATCCYCGTRAALVLKGRDRHELACSNCGAPLHDLKMLPKDRRGDRETVSRKRVSAPPEDVVRARPIPKAAHYVKPAKSLRPKKRRKGLWRKVFEEAVDLVEDIFD